MGARSLPRPRSPRRSGPASPPSPSYVSPLLRKGHFTVPDRRSAPALLFVNITDNLTPTLHTQVGHDLYMVDRHHSLQHHQRKEQKVRVSTQQAHQGLGLDDHRGFSLFVSTRF